ncbi:MAG: outer membrane protein transport protein [Leptospiraceae bacterium]|nr:outer membrane protein transport protein [Leptospiraceae bacterium]MCP5493033.1 outer membrane protein transport protein [Leptospiraceae bacterium]
MNSQWFINFLRNYSFLFIFFVIQVKINAGSYGDIYGAHPATYGMGNAVTATINNAAAPIYNIAGLGKLSEAEKILAYQEGKPRPSRIIHEFYSHYTVSKPRLTTSAPPSQDLSKTRDDYIGLGLAMNLNGIYNLERNIKFGVNIQAPGTGNLLTINDVNPTTHRYLQYGVANQKPTIMGGLGVEIIEEMLYVGVGFNAMASGNGAILMKDVPISPDRVVPNQQAILEVKPLITPIYGIQLEIGPFLAGASYRREVAMSVDSLQARAQTTLLGIQLDFDMALLDLYTPRVWSYGIGFKPMDELLIAVDVSRELWSAYKLSRTKKTYSETFWLNDITSYRAGVEYKISEMLKVRAGYSKKPSAVPNSPGEMNWMDFDKLVATGGASLTISPEMISGLRNPVIIDFAIGYQKLHGRHVFKYIATDKNPNYSSGGNVWYGGISFTFFM